MPSLTVYCVGPEMRETVDHESAAITGFVVVRVVLALVLLTAAGLKAYELATVPTSGTSVLESRWFLIGLVEAEFLFGLWLLLAGMLPELTRWAALGCFGLFAGVTLSKALAGESSCGCFGHIEVDPWYALALDVAAVVALYRCRPRETRVNVGRWSRAVRLAGIGVLWLTAAIPSGWAMGTFRSETMSPDGRILGTGRVVVLEPEAWLGRPFPLVKYIVGGERLAAGSWVVLMYNHGCPSCQDALPAYRRLARDWASRSGSPRVALLSVPPHPRSERSRQAEPTRGPWLRAKLGAVKPWHVEVPVELQLDDGVVTRVTRDDAADFRGRKAQHNHRS